MDFVNKFTGGSNQADKNTSSSSDQKQSSSGGGGLMDKVNSFAGGGKKGEQNEDHLDKGKAFISSKKIKHGPRF